ncbi:conserved Plasmodium protein, unknown function [Plasmodium ovale]|uniref:RRM domain-containing protein n=1 Tax=Plasmodium ovale TaxID=36330 RepID=A0A1D3U9C0_PLAOA|nr:conserved Plasmodium protein, unknown function [Plasmodium ovale]
MLGKRKLGEAQQQKKKKKWVEELDNDSEEIDLDCLNNLENEKINLEEIEEDGVVDGEEAEKEVNGKGKDEELNELNEDDTVSNGNNKKKKRYDWMSSDDEDISSDEEEEEDMENNGEGYEDGNKAESKNDGKRGSTDEIEKEGKTQSEGEIEENKRSGNYKESRSSSHLGVKENAKGIIYSNNQEVSNPNNHHSKNLDDKKKKVNDVNSMSNENEYDGSFEIIDNINKYSINPLNIKLEEIEHIITYVYFHNIHFNCITEHLVKFLESYTKNRIVQINSDKSTNYTVIYKYDEKKNDKVIINKFSHFGKLFVHVKNYQDVLRLLKLNETQFMGRIIKSIQAYKKKNSFFILQAPSHYKYFIQVVIGEKNKNSLNYVWMR